jgi:NAD(P)-dependent dehydrogenase (short-subunit alcohol dehydrogenase family)
LGSTGTRDGTSPYLSPYFKTKAAMDAIVVSYAAELNRWDIETFIIALGALTSDTNHFAHACSRNEIW